jgi:ElaB/YqjD/DUF883 family membrane-anchored ribosome-binding protein
MNTSLPEGTDQIIDPATARDIDVGTGAGPGTGPADSVPQDSGPAAKLRAEAQRLTGTASEKARDYASTGKERATGAIDSFADALRDAAGSVDDRLGQEYGEYARKAADSLASFATTLRGTDVEEIVAGARDAVRKSPLLAIGTAAALGFVVVRLLKAGGGSSRDDAA